MTNKTFKLQEISDFQSGLWKGKKGEKIKSKVLRNTNFTKSGKLNLSDVAELEVEVALLKKRKLVYGDIILEKSGGGDKTPVGRVCFFDINSHENFSFSNFTSRIRVKDSKTLDPLYYFWNLYFLYISKRTEKMQKHSTGIRNLKLEEYKEVKIKVPDMLDQKRIVAKLDKAFEEIDKVIEMTEQNAKNAEALLERSIPNIITKNSSEVITCTLGSAFSLSSGKFLSKKDMFNDGDINVYGGNGIAGKHNAYNLQGKNVLIGRVGEKCGNVHYVDESLWLTDNAMYAHTFNYEFNLEFLSLLLSKLNLGKYRRQAAQPVISFSSIKDIIISFPKDLREQKQIIKSVLDIENHTRSLTKLNKYRQENYNALKSSILAHELQREVA